MEFHQKRRQQFLTMSAYDATLDFYEKTACPGYLEEIASPEADASDRSRNAYSYADTCFTNFLLKYTAGEALENLREGLEGVISALELAARYVQEYAQDPTFPPLRFIEIDEYERVLQMIGLCFLLHRQDLLPRLAAIFDPSSASKDTLYEDLLAFGMHDRYDLDRWYHEAPYRDLVNCLYRDTEEECIVDLQRYLKNWYKSLNKAPWHESHLGIADDTCGGYFGYWAIEAGAVAYLMELDDSSFREHLVYPKDLVDFAREMDALSGGSRPPEQDVSQIRVDGGNNCLQTGYWFTPARQDSRRFFTAGELMPSFPHSPYGATIWQWSENQADD